MALTEKPLTESELPLVYDSWIKSYRKSPFAGCLPNHVAHTILRANIVDLLNAGATLRGVFDDGRCVAWVCEDLVDDTPVVHFAYIKASHDTDKFRPALRDMLAPKEGIYTYRTRWLTNFLGPSFRHEPGVARSRSLKLKEQP